MIPDRLPEALREVIAGFPAGALQFEVGIQTFDPIRFREHQPRQDYQPTGGQSSFPAPAKPGVHVHADLIAGLPGETIESFADGI